MEQRIGFCTASDGVRLAYAVTGSGPPLVKAANWLSHLEFDWESPLWRHWHLALSSTSTLIRYDARGCGLSDWDAADLSLDAWIDDLASVVREVGVEKFDLLGVSRGASVAAAYSARNHERVRRLVLYGGFARGWKRRARGDELEARHASMTLARVGWGQDNPAYRQFFTTQFVPDADEEQMRWFNEMQRMSTSAEMAVRLMESSGETDVTDILSTVRTPTLVAHARNDARCAFDGGRELAAGIPGSRFLALDSRNHILLEHEPAFRRFIDEMHAFLGRTSSPASPADAKEQGNSVREVTTMLFTDIVDSTRRAAEIGDKEWTKLLHRHHEVVRSRLRQFGGTEVDTTGDGFLATFASPLQGIKCAQRLIREIPEVFDLQIRAGIHTGECERVGDSLSGIAVHIAARIMSCAGPSQLLVSRTVRELTSGSDVEFEDIGARSLKGVPGEWQVFEVAV